jgi:hypothetical protein
VKTRLSRGVLMSGVMVMLLLLLVQFLVGMFVNLFVAIPPGHPGASDGYVRGAIRGAGWAVTSGAPALAIHTALGLLLTLGSLGLVAIATTSGGRALIVSTAIGTLGILGAGLCGIGFLNYSQNAPTFLMSVGFSVAIGAYVATLFAASLPVLRQFAKARRQAAG